MTCTGIRRLFDAYWDDETTQVERELIEAHFIACPDCRARYEAHARTLEAIGSLPRLEAAPDLVERVVASARRAERAPDRLPVVPTPVWLPAATAAAVLVVGALAVLPMLARRSSRLVAVSRTTTAAPRQPELVSTVAADASDGQRAAGLARTPARSGAAVATVTDSLFDHNADVEFILDPLAVRRGASTATRSVNGIQAERAVISF